MKILITENTAASGVMLSRGDVVELSKLDTEHLLLAGFATSDAKAIAARQAELATPAKPKA